MLRRWFGPKNSLIVCFDTWETLPLEDLSDQLDHIETYYHFVKLSALADDAKKGTPSGLVSIVFSYPRKGLFLKVLPELLSRSIPVTIFADTELTGTNRLPPREEVEIYRTAYPRIFDDRELSAMVAAWSSGEQPDPEPLLTRLRTLGIFPVEGTNPLNYMATWGKIGEIPGSLKEIGIRISRPPLTVEGFVKQCHFIEQRTASKVTAATDKRLLPSDDALKALGFQAAIGQRIGVVEKGVSRFDLPVFPLEKTSSIDENK